MRSFFKNKIVEHVLLSVHWCIMKITLGTFRIKLSMFFNVHKISRVPRRFIILGKYRQWYVLCCLQLSLRHFTSGRQMNATRTQPFNVKSLQRHFSVNDETGRERNHLVMSDTLVEYIPWWNPVQLIDNEIMVYVCAKHMSGPITQGINSCYLLNRQYRNVEK